MFTTPPRIHLQSGVSVVTAIFLVVILALMGVGMVSILTTSQQSISQEITSTKAYMAGRSCLQWGMYQATFAPGTAAGNHNTAFNNNNSGLFNTRCATAIDTLTADGLIFYNITAAASIGGIADPEYSARTMRLQFQP